MRRALMDELVAWKESTRRKPLILNGARQVGKTLLLKEFGRLNFENVAYVSLDNDPLARIPGAADLLADHAIDATGAVVHERRGPAHHAGPHAAHVGK